MLTRGLIKAEF